MICYAYRYGVCGGFCKWKWLFQQVGKMILQWSFCHCIYKIYVHACVCTYVCFVCMYIRSYVCTYVCMYRISLINTPGILLFSVLKSRCFLLKYCHSVIHIFNGKYILIHYPETTKYCYTKLVCSRTLDLMHICILPRIYTTLRMHAFNRETLELPYNSWVKLTWDKQLYTILPEHSTTNWRSLQWFTYRLCTYTYTIGCVHVDIAVIVEQLSQCTMSWICLLIIYQTTRWNSYRKRLHI